MDDSVERLAALMDDMLGVQKKMAASLRTQSANIISVQLGVLAIAEQLLASEHLDVVKAGQRMLELLKDVEPGHVQENAAPQTASFASRLEALASKPQTPEPLGTGLRLVVDNDE